MVPTSNQFRDKNFSPPHAAPGSWDSFCLNTCPCQLANSLLTRALFNSQTLFLSLQCHRDFAPPALYRCESASTIFLFSGHVRFIRNRHTHTPRVIMLHPTLPRLIGIFRQGEDSVYWIILVLLESLDGLGLRHVRLGAKFVVRNHTD